MYDYLVHQNFNRIVSDDAFRKYVKYLMFSDDEDGEFDLMNQIIMNLSQHPV